MNRVAVLDGKTLDTFRERVGKPGGC